MASALQHRTAVPHPPSPATRAAYGKYTSTLIHTRPRRQHHRIANFAQINTVCRKPQLLLVQRFIYSLQSVK